jgi:hypothetical protein
MHRTHNGADTDHIWTEIGTLQWVLAYKSLSVEENQGMSCNITSEERGEIKKSLSLCPSFVSRLILNFI